MVTKGQIYTVKVMIRYERRYGYWDIRQKNSKASQQWSRLMGQEKKVNG